MSTVFLDNRPLSDLVYAVLGLEGWRDAVPLDRSVSPYPGLAGAQLGQTATLDTREITVTVDIRPSLLSQRAAALDALYAACEGLHTLRVADNATREALVEFRGAIFRDYGGGALAHPGGYLEVRFRILSPWWSIEPRVVAPITTTPVPIVLGTAPSVYQLSVMGSATNPAVTLRAPSGRALGTLTLTGTVGATERLEITSDGTITIVTSAGVRTSAQSWRTSGDVPSLDPTDASALYAAPLTLTVSSGTGVLLYVPYYRS
jgi:hypothetical protein